MASFTLRQGPWGGHAWMERMLPACSCTLSCGMLEIIGNHQEKNKSCLTTNCWLEASLQAYWLPQLKWMNKSTSSQTHNFSSTCEGSTRKRTVLHGKFYVVSCAGKLGLHFDCTIGNFVVCRLSPCTSCLLQGGLHGCRTQSDRSCRGSRVSQAACINLNWHWTGNIGDVATWRSSLFLCVSSTLRRPSSKAVQTRQQTLSGHLWCCCRHWCQSGCQPQEDTLNHGRNGTWNISKDLISDGLK